METTWRQGWSRCLEKREQRWQQLKELMKLQTFSQLCFAGVQLMRPRRCIFAVLPRSSSVSVHQVAHAASHSCGLSSPTTPAFQGRTLGAPRAAEPCVSQLPASQAGEWSLVAREKTAASETSPAAAGLSGQPLLHLHHAGFLLAEPHLGKLLNTALTAASVLCTRDLNSADAFSFCCGPGLRLVCLSAAAKSSFLRAGTKSWCSREQLALSHFPGLFCMKGTHGWYHLPQTRGKNQLQMQLEEPAPGAAVDQSLTLSYNTHLSLARLCLPTFLIIYLGCLFSEPPPTKPCHFLPLIHCTWLCFDLASLWLFKIKIISL